MAGAKVGKFTLNVHVLYITVNGPSPLIHGRGRKKVAHKYAHFHITVKRGEVEHTVDANKKRPLVKIVRFF